MGIAQSTYTTAPAKGLPGQIANEEKSNIVSREVESALGIEFGQPAYRGNADHGVVRGAAFGAGAVAVAGSGNFGNGVMGAITVSAGARQGAYTLLITGAAANAGAFSVTNPDGVFVDDGDVGVAFNAGGLAFTLADGGQDFIVGDSFTINVTLTANVEFLGMAVLNRAVPAQASTPDRYPQYFTGAFMTMGQMYVVAGANVADGQAVYWNPATNRFTANEAHVRIPDAEFDTTGIDGDIVEISIKLR